MADTGNYVINSIFIEVEHQADGKKYPNYLKESYRLDAEGVLKYSGYFGGVPFSMNHNDGISWNSGVHGRKVFTTALSLLKKPFNTTGLKMESDSTESSGSYKIYFISFRKNDADATCLVDNPVTQAFKEIDAVFTDLIKAFEMATGRPLTIGDLPQ